VELNRRERFYTLLENGQWDANLALLDILGCSNIDDAMIWLKGSDHGLSVKALAYKAISQDICGTYLHSYFTGGNASGNHLSSKTSFQKYIGTLHRLCNSDEFGNIINESPWFSKYYSGLGDDVKETIDKNRAFLNDYLSPYKAVHAQFKGTNSPAEAIVLEIQNIHMLPLEVKSININGQTIPVIREVVIEGYVNGRPLPSKRFQVKVGSALIPILTRVVNEQHFEIDQFELNYSIYGTDRLITEQIRQH